MKINSLLKNYINGKYIDSSYKETLDVVYPATNEVITKTEVAGEKELELAFTAAKKAQKKWSQFLPAQKANVLNKAALIIRTKNDELAELEVMDTGKPLQEAISVDIQSGAEAVEYFSHAAALLKGDYYSLGDNYAQVIPEPLGVVAGIGAWNYPFQIACWKSAPALAAGNAMIFKPSELTTMTALKLAEIYKEAGLPDGLFNVLQGDARLGEAIVKHPEIKKVSLTGERETGKKIMANAASSLKQITLELGGKSPLIIFADADLDNAVQAAMMANFYTQGEICSNGTRVFLHKSIKEPFLEKLKKETEKLVMGDPMDNKTQIGSLINREHFNKVKSYIDLGLKEGAKRFIGSDPDTKQAGNFIGPTVFSDCHDDMRIVKEEIFGPVMSVLEFETEEEVTRRANDTPFGLAAGFFTKDINLAKRMGQNLEAGICWVNTFNITPIEIPFGGYKESGIGRENSMEALKAYCQLKSIYFESGDVDSPYR